MGGLSRLQQRIIQEIAAHHTMTHKAIANFELFVRCSDFWPESSSDRRPSFSRSLHRLLARGFIGALALMWVELEAERDTLVGWEGGGHGPRYKALYLTVKGWDVNLRLTGVEAAWQRLEREEQEDREPWQG